MFKFYLDGTELNDQPMGWDEFVLNIQFSKEERTLFVNYPSSLNFWGDGHKYIRDQRNINPCSLMTLEVDKECVGGYERVFSGFVNVTAVKFNRTKCTAEVQIEDNNIAARIRNNWEINVSMTAVETKNGSTIARPVGFALDVFDPTNVGGGSYVSVSPGLFFRGGLRTAFDVKIVLEFLIKVASDNELSLRSDWYDAFTDDEKLCIVMGKELRWGSFLPSEDITTFPELSLKTLFDSVAKAYNLVMYVEGSVVRIETLDSIRNTSDVFTLDNIKNIEETFDQEVLYSKVIFGNKEFDQDGLHSEKVLFLTHNTEEYHFVGECNVGSDLDLKINDIITDTNAIERTLIDGAGGVPDTLNRKYDEDIFMINYTSVTGAAKQYNIIDFDSNGPFQYNRILMNDAIAERHKLQGDLARSISNVVIPNIDFKAVASDADTYSPSDPWGGPGLYSPTETEVVISDIIEFDDDYSLGFDTAIKYGTPTPQGNPVPRANCKYEASVEGVYVFEANIGFNITGKSNHNNKDEINISLVRTDSLDVEIFSYDRTLTEIHKTQQVTDKVIDFVTIIETPFRLVIYMNVGDKIYMDFELTARSIFGNPGGILTTISNVNLWTDRDFSFLPGSSFTAISTPAETREFSTFDSNEYDFVMYRFEKSIANSEVQDLIASPTSRISANDDLGTISGFADNIDINMATGQSTFSIRSRENLISL